MVMVIVIVIVCSSRSSSASSSSIGRLGWAVHVSCFTYRRHIECAVGREKLLAGGEVGERKGEPARERVRGGRWEVE